MTTKHLVDPELLPFLDMIPPMDFSPGGLAARRAASVQMFTSLPVPEGLPVTCEETHVPGPAGAPPVRVLAYRPTEAEGLLPTVLHIHGGGHVLGLPEMMDIPNRELAATLGCAVYSVDYRLSPETAFPGPLEDCYAVLAWLHANAGPLGLDPARIGVKGESAGGTMAAGLTQLARDRGALPLAFQHLIMPSLDDSTWKHPDPNPTTGEFIWTREHSRFGWTAYLGGEPGSEDVSPYAVPARAENLAGLPPAFISLGALDLFFEEDLEYARRLSRAGVPVELHVYPGAFHAFEMVQTAAVTQRSRRDSKDALRRAFQARFPGTS